MTQVFDWNGIDGRWSERSKSNNGIPQIQPRATWRLLSWPAAIPIRTSHWTLKQQLQIEGQYRRLIRINKEIRNWIFRWNRLLVEHFKLYTFSVPCPPGWLLVIINAQGHSKRDFLSELCKVINFLLCKFDFADKVKLRFNRISKAFDWRNNGKSFSFSVSLLVSSKSQLTEIWINLRTLQQSLVGVRNLYCSVGSSNLCPSSVSTLSRASSILEFVRGRQRQRDPINVKLEAIVRNNC